MKIQTIALTNEEGKRQVKIANGVRAQMIEKITRVLMNEGLEVVKAANGDLAITTCVDAGSGNTFYTRLAVSLSDKPLDAKTEKKRKVKTEDETVIPELFADEDEDVE